MVRSVRPTNLTEDVIRTFCLAGEEVMDQIVTLDSRQEQALQKVADKFIALHYGDTKKAFKEMIVLNGHLQDKLDAQGPAEP